MKIGKELPFTLKNKRRNTNLKIDLLKVPFWTPEKVHFWFSKKTPQKICFFVFWPWFSFKNNRRTNFLLVGSFENTQKKVIDRQKRHFGCFWRLITFFRAFSKILIKLTCVCLLFLKLKQKKNMNKYFFMVFISKLKTLFFGGQGQPIFFLNFFLLQF